MEDLIIIEDGLQQEIHIMHILSWAKAHAANGNNIIVADVDYDTFNEEVTSLKLIAKKAQGTTGIAATLMRYKEQNFGSAKVILPDNVKIGKQSWLENPMGGWESSIWYDAEGNVIDEDEWEINSVMEYDKYNHPLKAVFVKKEIK